MPLANWTIQAPGNFSWTPAELAQIGRAVQAFQAELPNAAPGRIRHLVAIEGLSVLDGATLVDWPQPGEADDG